MRITDVLFKINKHRHFIRMWKRQGKMEIKKIDIPPELQALGVNIKDAREILNETKLFKPPEIKTDGLPYPLAPSVFTQEMPFYKMHNDTKVTEGENQIMVLTKTVPYQGLPKVIESHLDLEILPNQDEIVRTNILQALLWDAMQDKLPKVAHPNNPMYKCKRHYGILTEKKVSSLLEKLSFLCDSATGKYPGCFQRSKIQDAFCETAIQRNGSNVAFQMHCDLMLKAKEPLKRFASLAEVKETENMELPNIYPLKPTLDLDKCEENPLKKQITQYDSSFGSIHTLFAAQKTHVPWLKNELLAKVIGLCFAFTATEARLKYGEEVGILPEPISIQCMYLDVKSANFLAYQLNTLVLNNNEGIKNQVWIDEPSNLYSDVNDIDLLKDYNPSIFSKMLAFHIHGLHTKN